MRILVFTEGTIIMHSGAIGHIREQIVKQSSEGKESSLRDWTSYVPVGRAVKKLTAWKSQGAQILYLTSRVEPLEIEAIRSLLPKLGFPNGKLFHKRTSEEYCDAAERANPDMIIEDDCESIGGAIETTYNHLKPEFRHKIKSIRVKEFGGIDDLPDDLKLLAKYSDA